MASTVRKQREMKADVNLNCSFSVWDPGLWSSAFLIWGLPYKLVQEICFQGNPEFPQVEKIM